MDISVHERTQNNPSSYSYLDLLHAGIPHLPDMEKMSRDKEARKRFVESLKPCVENCETALKETEQILDECVKKYGQNVRNFIELDEYPEESENEEEESDEDLLEWYDSLCEEVNKENSKKKSFQGRWFDDNWHKLQANYFKQFIEPKPSSTPAGSSSQAADPQASTKELDLNLSDLPKPSSTPGGSSSPAANPQASAKEFDLNLSFRLMKDVLKFKPEFFEKKIPKDKLHRALSTSLSATASFKVPDVSKSQKSSSVFKNAFLHDIEAAAEMESQKLPPGLIENAFVSDLTSAAEFQTKKPCHTSIGITDKSLQSGQKRKEMSEVHFPENKQRCQDKVLDSDSRVVNEEDVIPITEPQINNQKDYIPTISEIIREKYMFKESLLHKQDSTVLDSSSEESQLNDISTSVEVPEVSMQDEINSQSEMNLFDFIFTKPYLYNSLKNDLYKNFKVEPGEELKKYVRFRIDRDIKLEDDLEENEDTLPEGKKLLKRINAISQELNEKGQKQMASLIELLKENEKDESKITSIKSEKDLKPSEKEANQMAPFIKLEKNEQNCEDKSSIKLEKEWGKRKEFPALKSSEKNLQGKEDASPSEVCEKSIQNDETYDFKLSKMELDQIASKLQECEQKCNDKDF